MQLVDAQRRIALSAEGEGGARLTRALAMPVSGDTMLRLIRASPLPEASSPRVVGIDDWAWRRGQRYGTLIVDLERACQLGGAARHLPPRHSKLWLDPGAQQSYDAGYQGEVLRQGLPSVPAPG